MSTEQMALPYYFKWSTTHPHIAWADLHGNGTREEVAVVSIDKRSGDLFYIPITSLDHIDRARLIQIISKRDAINYTLWDLMDMTTLRNGLNALEYFHQLVQVRTMSGQIFKAGLGKTGINTVGAHISQQKQPAKPNSAPPAKKSAGRAPPKVD